MAEEREVIACQTPEQWTLNIETAKKEQKLVVVYFTSTWCGPCRISGPVMVELAKKYPTVIFLKVDVDDLEDVAKALNVHALPAYTFLENGEKNVYELSGVNHKTRDTLAEAIEKYSNTSDDATSTSAI